MAESTRNLSFSRVWKDLRSTVTVRQSSVDDVDDPIHRDPNALKWVYSCPFYDVG